MPSDSLSYLDYIFRYFDPSLFNIRCDSSQADHLQQHVVSHCKDILRSAVSYSAPVVTYDLSLLHLVLLTTDDLAILWENKIRSMQM